MPPPGYKRVNTSVYNRLFADDKAPASRATERYYIFVGNADKGRGRKKGGAREDETGDREEE